MPKYTYTGKDEVTMGRFGLLKKGDVIDLTLKEEAYILETKHPHLKATDPKDAKKPNADKLPEDFDKLSDEEKEKAKKDEAARQASLQKANQETADLRLKEMTKAELEEEVAKLRSEGKEVKVQKGASKSALINAVLEAQGLQPHASEE